MVCTFNIYVGSSLFTPSYHEFSISFGEICVLAQWPIRWARISSFRSIRLLEVFLFLLDGILVCRRTYIV